MLIEKCLHGRTQNVNEAFDAYVWKRKNVLDMSVASAVVVFNDGASGYYNMECSHNGPGKNFRSGIQGN